MEKEALLPDYSSEEGSDEQYYEVPARRGARHRGRRNLRQEPDADIKTDEDSADEGDPTAGSERVAANESTQIVQQYTMALSIPKLENTITSFIAWRREVEGLTVDQRPTASTHYGRHPSEHDGGYSTLARLAIGHVGCS